MRYFFAILSLVIAGALLLLGVGQRTFLAGPKTVTEVIETSDVEEQFLVIPAKVFNSIEGNPSLVLGGKDLFIATAEHRDIYGWVQAFDHITVDVDETTGIVSFSKVNGIEYEDEPNTSPLGSDLWLAENTGETTLTLSSKLEPSQALLVTSGLKEQLIPEEVTLMWAQPRNTPLAGPLLLAGGIFAALGGVLYLLAIDHDRRGLGPRRGRRGPLQGLRNKRIKSKRTSAQAPNVQSARGKKVGFSIIFAVSGALVLSACSPAYWPQAAPVSQVEEQPVTVDENLAVIPVNEEQLNGIVDRIVTQVSEADSVQKSSILKEVAQSAALEQRRANYKIRKKESDWRALPHLTSERLGYDLIQSTDKWPRTLFVAVNSISELVEPEVEEQTDQIETNSDSDKDDEKQTQEGAGTGNIEPAGQTPTLALVMVQETPHQNYMLQQIIELRGGIEMPSIAPATEGTAVLAEDIQTLKLSPIEAAEHLATTMQKGANAYEAEFFEFTEEPLVEKMGRSWAKDQCVSGLKCVAKVTVAPESVVTLSTGQSGALVLATLVDKHSMTVKNDRSIVKLSKVERALGLDGAFSRVTREWQHQVLMYVPGKESENKITILGSSSELVDATGKEVNF